MSLILSMRSGDLLRINGSTICFRSAVKIEMVDEARFVFGKQVLEETKAVTPLQKLYFAIQEAYVGDPQKQTGWIQRAREIFTQIPSFSSVFDDSLEKIRLKFEASNYREALCGLRKLLKQK